jgi:ribosomal protein S18 acetylase RimI-like enzyme
MFASIELAQRIDGAETRLTESVVRAVIGAAPSSRAFVEAIGGGVAAYAGRSSPMSKMIGVGLRGTPSETELQQVEDAFRARGAPLQAEVATLAEPALALLLTKRGYVLQNFENVSGRRIVDDDRTPPDAGDVRIARMTATNAAEWIDVAITAFQHPDGEGVPADALPQREVLEAALWPWTRIDDFRKYGAWVDGHLAGVATLRVDDGIAQLCGAATLPRFRRRGIQAALLRTRLADGAEAGCDIVVATTQPGSTSQANLHKQGFSLLYARALLLKSPPE